MSQLPPSTSAAVFKGVRRALPIVLGYVPIGFAYGVLAGKSGISAANTVLMSLIVFAGSAQFIAVGLFASGSGPAVVILTTFVVNLRHLLMAASLAPYLSKWSRRRQALCRLLLSSPRTASISAGRGGVWMFIVRSGPSRCFHHYRRNEGTNPASCPCLQDTA